MLANAPVPGDGHAASVLQSVPKFTQQLVSVWWDCPTTLPALGPALAPRDQSSHERYLEGFLDLLTDEVKHPPASAPQRRATQERILSRFRSLAWSGLGWEDRQIDLLLTRGFIPAAEEFVQMARQFEPAVSWDDIYQAGRNVATANGLQVLLGLPVQLTPALFAYSMLYPYSDNYLDDARVQPEAKRAFSEQFRRRLAGESVSPANSHEERIFQLVSMIEGQFDRARYPLVFESLLAIHRAQAKSLRLLRRDASPYEVDVLGISLEKGGTSVLADAYLAAGTLTPFQVECAFGLGAFLQLGDDLEDVAQDLHDGLLTVFSQTARRWPLDGVTSRALHLGAHVAGRLNDLDAPGSEPLKELIGKSMLQAFTLSASRAPRLYSRRYLQELESHSPFRFAFLDKQLKRLDRQRAPLMRLLESATVET